MATLDDVIAAAAAEHDVVTAAVGVISGLRDKLAAAGTDPVKLADLVNSLDTDKAALAAAIATPPDPTPAPAPAPDPAPAPAPADPSAPTDGSTP
jgi:hypothetical protein